MFSNSFLMKILSWNVRGLRRPEKRRKIKNLVRDKKIDVLLLQEIKRCSVDENFVKSLWPWEEMGYMEAGAEGSAGGILCLWNPEIFLLKECCSNRNFILLAGTSLHCFDCVIVNIYAPNDVLGRRQLWESLVKLKSTFSKPWCVGGILMKLDLSVNGKG